MAVGEWDKRQLCSDGACVGVIGPDGTCKVCGRAAPNWGDERNRGLLDPPDEPEPEDASDDKDDDLADDDLAASARDEDDDEDDDDDDDDGYDEEDDGYDEDDDEDDEAGAGASTVSPGVWSTRQLCSDGSCVGVIGADGRCKVCGRRAGQSAAAEPEIAASSPPPPATTTDDPDGQNNGP